MSIAALPPPSTDGEGLLYDIVDGHRLQRQMSALATLVASELHGHLFVCLRPRKVGVAVTEQIFRLAPRPAKPRRPDVAVVPYDRWPEPTPSAVDPWEVVPSMATEVISPSNRVDEVLIKVDEYLAAGVSLVWIIFPEQRRAHVYDRESPNLIRVVGPQDFLDGATVLPGFRLSMADLFQSLTKPNT